MPQYTDPVEPLTVRLYPGMTALLADLAKRQHMSLEGLVVHVLVYHIQRHQPQITIPWEWWKDPGGQH